MYFRRHLAIGIVTFLTVVLPFAQVPDDPLATVNRVIRRLTSTYDFANHPPRFVAAYRAVKKRALPIAEQTENARR